MNELDYAHLYENWLWQISHSAWRCANCSWIGKS